MSDPLDERERRAMREASLAADRLETAAERKHRLRGSGLADDSKIPSRCAGCGAAVEVSSRRVRVTRCPKCPRASP